MTVFRRSLATAALGLALVAGTVQAETLSCTFPRQGLNSWIRGQIIVRYDPVKGEATVFDSLINQEHGGPIPARVTTDNPQRLTLRWQLRDMRTRIGFAPSINYALTYIKASGQGNANANAPAVEDFASPRITPAQFSARGTCAPR